jgi:hypothetical protein
LAWHEAEGPGQHGAGEIGIDEQCTGLRTVGECVSECEEQSRSPFGAVATREENDFGRLVGRKASESLSEVFEAVGVGVEKVANKGRPTDGPTRPRHSVDPSTWKRVLERRSEVLG